MSYAQDNKITDEILANGRFLELSSKLSKSEENWLVETDTLNINVLLAPESFLKKSKIVINEKTEYALTGYLYKDNFLLFTLKDGKNNFILRDENGNPQWDETVNSANYRVIPDKCIGCRICINKCPVNAITLVNNKAVIDTEKCIKCGICDSVCPVDAIKKPGEK